MDFYPVNRLLFVAEHRALRQVVIDIHPGLRMFKLLDAASSSSTSLGVSGQEWSLYIREIKDESLPWCLLCGSKSPQDGLLLMLITGDRA